MRKLYYALYLTLLSPLHIGADSITSENDIALTADGKPYIPASSLAGVLRQKFQRMYPQDTLDAFGEYHSTEHSSHATFYHAHFTSLANEKTSRRSILALNYNKIMTGLRHTMQVVEAGATACGFIEWDDTDPALTAKFEHMLSTIGTFKLGAKITRGYGKIHAEIIKKSFELDPTHIEMWLNFDLFAADAFADGTALPCTAENLHRITVDLQVLSSPMVRQETTDFDPQTVINPDYKHTTLSDGTPFIPGTSWAGAFRRHIYHFLRDIDPQTADTKIIQLFGGRLGKDYLRSRLTFSESVISGSTPKIISRISVDRFTGACANRALFTEKAYIGGHTTLEIEYDRLDAQAEQLLLYALNDLHNGILSVGGLTNIGYGLLRIENIVWDGKTLPISDTHGIKREVTA